MKIFFVIFLAFLFTACHKLPYYDLREDADFGRDFGEMKFEKNNTKAENLNIKDEILKAQNRFKNTPYRLGGESVSGIDCSGFVSFVFKEHFKLEIPRTTTAQLNNGEKITRNELKSGDVLFFRTGRGPNGLHNGIYLDDDEFVHISTSKGGAKIVSLNAKYWKSKFIGARRYLK